MWLLTQAAWDLMVQWRTNQIELNDERIEAVLDKSSSPGALIVANKAGVIHIEGILTQKRDWGAMFFGGGNTLYPDIISSLAEADADPEVERIILQVGESPGGNISGMFKTMEAIRATSKPVDAVVADMAASATYGLVSQADKITVANNMTAVGSVGVAQAFLVFDELVEIASTHAPKKRPDVSTEEGKAVAREVLDEIETPFIDAIAQGRGTTPEAVKQDFGQGALVLSQRAKRMGMIDAIAPKIQPTAAISGDNTMEVIAMDLQELMAKHPEIYKAAVQEGKKQGIDQERKRCNAHLVHGKASGDFDGAIKAVESGAAYDMEAMAAYNAAALDRQTIDARTQDNVTVVLDPAETSDSDVNDKAKQFDAQVAAAMSYGLDMEALTNG